jgi:hypothetical protein
MTTKIVGFARKNWQNTKFDFAPEKKTIFLDAAFARVGKICQVGRINQ